MKKLSFLTILLLSFYATAQVYQPSAVDGVSVPYYPVFKKYAKEYDVPVAALLAIASKESGMKVKFRNDDFCGLMGLSYHDPIFITVNGEKCFDPDFNIKYGAETLSQWIEDTKKLKPNFPSDKIIRYALSRYRYAVFEDEKPNDKYIQAYQKEILPMYDFYLKNIDKIP